MRWNSGFDFSISFHFVDLYFFSNLRAFCCVAFFNLFLVIMSSSPVEPRLFFSVIHLNLLRDPLVLAALVSSEA